MAELPEQLTTEKLKQKIDQRLAEIERAQIEEPSVRVVRVQGAHIDDAARGALLLRPNSERVVDIPYFASSVAVTYEGLKPGRYAASTSSARLLKVGDRWRRESLLGPWQGLHLFEVDSEEVTLVYHLPDRHSTAIMPPTPAPLDDSVHQQAVSRVTYEIPPPATEIKGTGVVHHLTGHNVKVKGRALLKRPLATGELGIRPGGISATFSTDIGFTGDVQVRIGTSWLTLEPKSENPRG